MYASVTPMHVNSLRLRFAFHANRSSLVSRLRSGAGARSAEG
jgi:hypothetical protein